MPFRETPRTIYERNTLTAVVALVRFPTILRIQAEAPIAFQERVRGEFPVYDLVDGQQIQFPSDVPSDVQMAVRAGLQGMGGLPVQHRHRFATPEGNWNLQLSQDSLALTCKAYPDWESFLERWINAFAVLVDVYRPAFATLVALRYQNAIVRSKLELDNTRWAELLSPSIAAEFAAGELRDEEITTSAHRLDVSLGDIGRVRIQHGLGKFVPTAESAYIIDNEFLAEFQIGLSDVTARLASFHDYSGRIFNFAISERLKASMVPRRGA